MSKKYAGLGFQLQMGDGASPENFTAIAAIQDLKAPAIKADTVDATTHQSPGWKEKLVTLLDGGDVSFPIIYDPAEATHKNAAGGLSYVMLQKILKNWKIRMTDDAHSFITFAAFVTDFQVEGPVENLMKATIKLTVSGAVTLP